MPLPLESFWQEVGFTPNPQQREAILQTDGPLYLTKGPGSGKTPVLLGHILNLQPLLLYNNTQTH